MKQTNTVLELLKLFLTFLISLFLWLFIIASLPGDSYSSSEPFPGATTVFAVVTTLGITAAAKYNSMQRAWQATRSALSNIEIHEEKTRRLLDKATRVAEQYMGFEERVQLGVAEGRRSAIRSSRQFQVMLEAYPELKSNVSVMELLMQMKDCENSAAYQKVAYNRTVEHYNTLIHSFPASLFRKAFRFQDAAFYTAPTETELISDEELGI